jgi:choline dehydrogenase-like flavoprotein
MKDLSSLQIKGIPDPWAKGIAGGWDVIDGARIDEDETLEADVVIVGSGAGGGVSAEILAQAGLKVIVVEAGRLQSSDDFDMQESRAYRNLYQESGAMATKDGGISILQGRTLGGSTVVNWTSSFRTPEQTLNHWRDVFGVADLDRPALDPWFAQMEKRLGITTWEGELNANNDVLRRGCEEMGWHWERIPRNVNGCWDLGYCGLGCPVNAKQSMLVTTLPGALEAGATVIHSCPADRLELEGDRVRAVTCGPLDAERRPTGATLTIRADQVVAAGGGIHTPGLLLRSEVPDPYGRLGKRTFLHVTSSALGFFEEEIAGYYGAPQSTYSDEFVWREGVTGPMGYKLEVMPVHPGFMAGLSSGFGTEHRDQMTRLPWTSAALGIMRDGFHEDSPGGQVELRDDGSPMLDYPLTDYVLDGARRSLITQTEMLFAAGAKTVQPRHGDSREYKSLSEAKAAIDELRFEPFFVTLGSAHVMGGCAMGSDPEDCLVDDRGRYHHLANLHVFDGSVFPTSLGVNPQLTIYGITARNATRLAEELTGTEA